MNTQDIPIISGHYVTEERKYDHQNPAGQRFGKEPWVKVCVVMLPYNLLANGLAIIHPKTGNQENAFAYSAYGDIRTHSQLQKKAQLYWN